MKSKLDKMREKTDIHLNQAMEINKENYKTIDNHLGQVQAEYHRVAELSGQAALILNEIDEDFKRKTKLSNTDIILLFLCTAIQCTRQYLLSNDTLKFQKDGYISSSDKGDLMMRKVLTPLPRDWRDILTQSVPYDVTERDPVLGNLHLSGNNHRYKTLGHDPVLGWIFGTSNIITTSLTKHDFFTYSVEMGLLNGRNKWYISHPYNEGTFGMLNDTCMMIEQDKKLLPIAVARQAVHYGSDYFTTQGLPVPLVSSLDNDLSEKMIQDAHIDMWSITKGAVMSTFINYLIYCIHKLFYNPDKDGTESMYEVRSRKILSYSNAMASGSNAIVVAMTGDLTKLDVGGMLVTIHRLVSDYKFINEVKKDFLKNEFYKMVVGDNYDFMED